MYLPQSLIIEYVTLLTQNVFTVYIYIYIYIYFLWRCCPTLAMASSFLRFLDHTQRRTTVDRTPLDEWSARRRDLYLTTHNTHNRQTSMPPVGFEPTIPAVRAAADLRLRPRGHWDRHIYIYIYLFTYIYICINKKWLFPYTALTVWFL